MDGLLIFEGRHLKYVLDARGEPRVELDLFVWALWMEEADRTIAVDRDEGPSAPNILVSTVFLGLDMGFGDVPILFETMVFVDGTDVLQRRYATRVEALRGHQVACRWVRRSRPKES